MFSFEKMKKAPYSLLNQLLKQTTVVLSPSEAIPSITAQKLICFRNRECDGCPPTSQFKYPRT